MKSPIIVTNQDDPAYPNHDPDNVTKENVTEKYAFWLISAVRRWKTHYETYADLGTKPVLFIMAEKNVYADAIGNYLEQTKEFGLSATEILVIHTDSEGEVTKADLELAPRSCKKR